MAQDLPNSHWCLDAQVCRNTIIQILTLKTADVAISLNKCTERVEKEYMRYTGKPLVYDNKTLEEITKIEHIRNNLRQTKAKQPSGSQSFWIKKMRKKVL